MSVAIVLAPSAELPDEAAFVDAYYGISPNAHEIVAKGRQGEATAMFEIEGVGDVYVSAMPGPVPNGEVEHAARLGFSTLGKAWSPAHAAHLLVAVQAPRLAPIDRMPVLTTLAAAAAQTTDAIGVYWGGGRVAHPTKSFLETARGIDLPIALWCGVSAATDPHRVQYLSIGMDQFGLPDLLLTAARLEGPSALSTFFQFLSHLARRGAPLEPGHTLGRTAHERIPVRYQPSPIDPAVQVWCVDLPRRGS